MTGRGIDQILPHGGDPSLREPAVTDARVYIRLAERLNGPIPRPVPYTWPWGEVLAVAKHMAPDVRLLNLETSITEHGDFAAGKSVHYRMHPDNIECLTVVRPDVCVLANNHVLDFGVPGLVDSLGVLSQAGLRYVGAGLDAPEAERPVVTDVAKGGRVITVAAGMPSSGVPRHWAASQDRPGVAVVIDLSRGAATELARRAVAPKKPGDVAVASLHWGSNWGYAVDRDQVRFAHWLIDAGIDLVHGHSSHHPRPIEVYRGKLILYGCGDLVNDYEGIGGYEHYRDELRLLYFASLEPDTGQLTALQMVPLRAEKMRLERAARDDAEWLRARLEHASGGFGTRIDTAADGVLNIRMA
jgi:poly-gamma-glutamate synthesis protein (capsule biosynthesis protein)